MRFPCIPSAQPLLDLRRLCWQPIPLRPRNHPLVSNSLAASTADSNRSSAPTFISSPQTPQAMDSPPSHSSTHPSPVCPTPLGHTSSPMPREVSPSRGIIPALPDTQVYLYALGGNPGAGVNSGAGLLAALGNCPSSGSFLATVPFISINEVTTVAAAYAMAGFATDATHVSSSGTPLALTGIANAFANAANLADISTGIALTITPAGNGTVPNTTINSLANILAACINSNGPLRLPAPPYSPIPSAAAHPAPPPRIPQPQSSTSPTTPAPTSQLSSLFLRQPRPSLPRSRPFPMTSPLSFDTTFPNINSQSFLTSPSTAQAMPGFPTSPPTAVFELSSNGSLISPDTGYAVGQLDIFLPPSPSTTPATLGSPISAPAISPSSPASGTVISPASGFTGGRSQQSLRHRHRRHRKRLDCQQCRPQPSANFSNAGTAISPASGYAGGGINHPVALAIDSSSNAWTTNISNHTISKFSNAGVALSPPSGYAGGGLNGPFSIAIDGFGNAWIANGNLVNNMDTITKFSSDGTPVSPSSGFTGGGLSFPTAIAVDGTGNIWVANIGATISEFSNNGVAISPPTGYSLGPHYLNAIAVDGSGNVWVTTDADVVMFVGAATPVVTPIATGVKNNALGARP